MHLEYTAPFLLVVYILASLSQRIGLSSRKDKRLLWGTLPLAAFLSFFPIGGISVTDFVLSFSPTFSIGSIALLLQINSRTFTGKSLISRRELLGLMLWNVLISISLYASSLGFVSWDLYALGYRFSMVFVITAIVTILLILCKQPLAFLFIAYILAFHLELLPSRNFFDYLTDGVLFLISVIFLLNASIRYLSRKMKLPQPSGETS